MHFRRCPELMPSTLRVTRFKLFSQPRYCQNQSTDLRDDRSNLFASSRVHWSRWRTHTSPNPGRTESDLMHAKHNRFLCSTPLWIITCEKYISRDIGYDQRGVCVICMMCNTSSSALASSFIMRVCINRQFITSHIPHDASCQVSRVMLRVTSQASSYMTRHVLRLCFLCTSYLYRHTWCGMSCVKRIVSCVMFHEPKCVMSHVSSSFFFWGGGLIWIYSISSSYLRYLWPSGEA